MVYRSLYMKRRFTRGGTGNVGLNPSTLHWQAKAPLDSTEPPWSCAGPARSPWAPAHTAAQLITESRKREALALGLRFKRKAGELLAVLATLAECETADASNDTLQDARAAADR